MSKDFEGISVTPNKEAIPKYRKDRALLMDQGNGDGKLEDNLQVFETIEEVKVYAATDRGIGKEENHDRVIIDPVNSQFVVLDGMGSAGASQILAEAILANPNDLGGALEKAKLQMMASRVHAGTCLVSGQLTSEKVLKVHQVGDCGAVVFDAKGQVKFSAADKSQVRVRVDTLEVNISGIERKSQYLVGTLPGSYVSSTSGELHKYSDVNLEDGDTVLLFSDVIWSNLSMNELSKLVMQHRNPQNLFLNISEILNQKMRSERSFLESGFSSHLAQAMCYYGGDYVPSPDNQSLVLFRV